MNDSPASTERIHSATRAFVMPVTAWIVLAVGCAALATVFNPALRTLIDVWFTSEEFSYGPILPLVCAFLVWQQKDNIAALEFSGSWTGMLVFVIAAVIAIVGQLATVPTLVQYGLLLAVAGLVLAMTGWQAFRLLLAPFAILLLAIPLPAFFMNNLSSQLQLLSSQLGVWVIRLFGISVFVEGNVIDLGEYRLQVAEACDGLRYLFPLMTLGFIMAYFFKVAMWKRVVLFLSTIPITILMNSFRIGTIGVMVEHWGTRMAEGFLHDFQGWAVFMASAAIMLGEMIVLARIGRDARPWREVFGLEFPAPMPRGTPRTKRAIPKPFIASSIVLVVLAAGIALVPERTEAIPVRESFVSFPSQITEWAGRRDTLDRIYLDALKLDDYVIADYVRNQRDVVNFYVAWYDSQRAGQSAHSPRSCLPGGGWRITALDQRVVPGVTVASQPLRVNRALIELGSNKQVIYYWFQQRGRIITNEYLVKWYLFWDSLTRQRTDGALVRLSSPVRAGEAPQDADGRLIEFARQAGPRLERYIPN
jgi:exosortase D (VPLPA-CTERM-specific)